MIAMAPIILCPPDQSQHVFERYPQGNVALGRSQTSGKIARLPLDIIYRTMQYLDAFSLWLADDRYWHQCRLLNSKCDNLKEYGYGTFIAIIMVGTCVHIYQRKIANSRMRYTTGHGKNIQ